MQSLKILLLVFALCGFAPEAGCLGVSAAELEAGRAVAAQVAGGASAEAANTAAHAQEGHHSGILPSASVLVDLGFFQINNSMVITWTVALALILLARMATRNMDAVPSGLQNFWEWMVESLYDFLKDIVGPELVRKTFWFSATLFIFILFTNWFGLIPGVGSIGWGTPDATGHLHHISTPILRGGNADLNMTSAMALTFFACWFWWSIQANGVGGFIKHIFGYPGDAKGIAKLLLGLVFIAVGVLELFSIAFRPVSLSFRLFGNIFAGENLLEAMALMGGTYLGWLIALPFYFMELIVGFVQALVFMLLTAIFTALMCQHSEEHGHEAGAHQPGHGDGHGAKAASH